LIGWNQRRKRDAVSVVACACIISEMTSAAPLSISPALVSSPLTRHLEQLDAFVISATAYPPTVVDTSSCRGFRRLERPSGDLEKSDWQRMTASSDESFVFSAHLDTRWRPVPLIQIIGITSTDLGTVFCRMWYSDSPQAFYTRANVESIGETHGRRFNIYSPLSYLSSPSFLRYLLHFASLYCK